MDGPPTRSSPSSWTRAFPAAPPSGRSRRRSCRQRTLRQRLDASSTEYCPLIKPSDNWNFTSGIIYDKIEETGGIGYIPGDLYANCLFYFTRPGDLVVAPMAGSGQIRRVYDDRGLWMRPTPWELDLRMFDLNPRGRYRPLISAWDLTQGFPPVERAPDYVVMDVPYLGCCKGQYSAQADDIANMDEPAWTRAMEFVARSCGASGAKLVTVIAPNWVNHDTGAVTLCCELIRDAWKDAGYALHRVCYASKGIQAARTHRIAVLNNRAKRMRLPLRSGDIALAEVLTFRRAVDERNSPPASAQV